MSHPGESAPATAKTVGVAVKGRRGGDGGCGSRRAVRWAVKNLMPGDDCLVLIYVMPSVTSIPTPSGDHIPVEELDANVVLLYVQDLRARFEEIFIPFKRLCKSRKVKTLVLEGDNPASTLLRYISDSGMTNLVLGSSTSSCIRNPEGQGVPSRVLKDAPDTCNIYVVSGCRVLTNSANPLSTSGDKSRHWLFTRIASGISRKSAVHSSSLERKVSKTSGPTSISNHSYPDSPALISESFPIYSDGVQEREEHEKFRDDISETQTVEKFPSLSSTYAEQLDVQAEVDKLRLELQNTVAMYNQACEDLVCTQNMVNQLSSDCLEEAQKVNSAQRREEAVMMIIAEEKEKHLEATKEVEMARHFLAKETSERQAAQQRAFKESLEKQKIVDALFGSDKRYRRYSRDEIEVATDFFSETKVIGEGSYGKVYKCNLDHTPVAIKVVQPGASDKKEEFLREVEVLSQLHHPHIVLLLGACPESGCLIYEYMENGSLEDHIFQLGGKPPLPWFVRFRIIFEVGCGLAFLHNSKPEPTIHRDLKPGNIFLDRNYVSKIGDVGLAKLISEIVPDDITEYRNSILAGTLYYMDPEYQRTGTVRPKSDLYALGIIMLQLLAGSHPNGLLLKFENAVASGSFADILDRSITDWPLSKSEELARLALKCSRLRCRDRPDLETEVLPVLKNLAEFASCSAKVERNNINAPSHYCCPILQEVMDEPFSAADGLTYEHKAIKTWLDKHNVSPVTKLKLQHKMLTPNHMLRSAIQEWRTGGLTFHSLT